MNQLRYHSGLIVIIGSFKLSVVGQILSNNNIAVQHKEYQLDIRVYYEDTDMGGIVYYANYLKFFERARSDWFRELGIDQEQLRLDGVGFVVRRVEVDNLLSSRFNQLLSVRCRIANKRRTSLTFEQAIYNSDDQLICTGVFIVVCVDLNKMKPLPFPANIAEVLNVVC